MQATSVITHFKSNVNIERVAARVTQPVRRNTRVLIRYWSQVKLCSGCHESPELIGLKILVICLQPNRIKTRDTSKSINKIIGFYVQGVPKNGDLCSGLYFLPLFDLREFNPLK